MKKPGFRDIRNEEAFFISQIQHMEHCRGSLVREGGSLESYWCPAPQEFKSLPRRSASFDQKKGIGNLVCFQIFQICANRIAISGNEIIARMPPIPADVS